MNCSEYNKNCQFSKTLKFSNWQRQIIRNLSYVYVKTRPINNENLIQKLEI